MSLSSVSLSVDSSTSVRQSQFTFRDLQQLSLCKSSSPLRIIAHIDLDAFYAQCESVRLNLTPEVPLAVQQWQGLIAINYPARASGLQRHCTAAEAREKCPNIVLQHVATWKVGEESWKYRDDTTVHNPATEKVSLDPYRQASRKILQCVRESLKPQSLQRIEKASVDEFFFDLSAIVHSILLSKFPQLNQSKSNADLNEFLPAPPRKTLRWHKNDFVFRPSSHGLNDGIMQDWDDFAFLIASGLIQYIREAIFKKFHFTCSAGLAKNKMLAKLGSSYRKPNSQTIILNRYVTKFLEGRKFTDIRGLGGKLGDQLVEKFQVELIDDILQIPLLRLRNHFDESIAAWLYDTFRGNDFSDVSPFVSIKTMLSAKSFRPGITDFETLCSWLRIFSSDIHSRFIDDEVFEQNRRPRTLTITLRTQVTSKSKQASVPLNDALTEFSMFELAKNLLVQLCGSRRTFPCMGLSLSFGNFEGMGSGSKKIENFFAPKPVLDQLPETPRAKCLNRESNVEVVQSCKRSRSQADLPGGLLVSSSKKSHMECQISLKEVERRKRCTGRIDTFFSALPSSSSLLLTSNVKKANEMTRKVEPLISFSKFHLDKLDQLMKKYKLYASDDTKTTLCLRRTVSNEMFSARVKVSSLSLRSRGLFSMRRSYSMPEMSSRVSLSVSTSSRIESPYFMPEFFQSFPRTSCSKPCTSLETCALTRCTKCSMMIPNSPTQRSIIEHSDWHIAQQLQSQYS